LLGVWEMAGRLVKPVEVSVSVGAQANGHLAFFDLTGWCLDPQVRLGKHRGKAPGLRAGNSLAYFVGPDLLRGKKRAT
jgi:hypothetical protein